MKKAHALMTIAFAITLAIACEANAKEYKFANKGCDRRTHPEPGGSSGVSDERSNPLFNSGWNGGAGSNAGSYGENPPAAPTAPNVGTGTRTGTSHGAGDFASST